MKTGKTDRRDFLKATSTVAESAALGAAVATAEVKEKVVNRDVDAPVERTRSLTSISTSRQTEDGFHVFERVFSDHDEYLSVGIANIH